MAGGGGEGGDFLPNREGEGEVIFSPWGILEFQSFCECKLAKNVTVVKKETLSQKLF